MSSVNFNYQLVHIHMATFQKSKTKIGLYFCYQVFLLTCILFLFNADVNWLPCSTGPFGYSRQLVLKLLIEIVIFSLARMITK